MDDDEGEGAIAEALTVEIRPPVTVNQVSHAELVLRQPTLSQVRDAHGKLDDAGLPSIASQREYELTFVALVARKPREVIDRLPVRVLRQAVDYLESWVRADLPDAPDDDDSQLIIALDPPLKSNGGEVHELVLREPTGGEMRKAEDLLGKGGAPLPGPIRRYQARLIEQVSGLSPLIIGQLPISVSKEAIRFLERFERSGQPITRK